MACNQSCEVYSRIVGYYRPVQQWNKGKRAEFDDRKTYNVAKLRDAIKQTDRRKK